MRARRISSAVGLAEGGFADATSARDRLRDGVVAGEPAADRAEVSSWRPARAGGFRTAWSDFRAGAAGFLVAGFVFGMNAAYESNEANASLGL